MNVGLLEQLALADRPGGEKAMPDVAADLRMRLADDPGRFIDRVVPWDSCHVAHALIVRYIWQIARRIAARHCPAPRTKKPAISRGSAISTDGLSRGMSPTPSAET